MTAVMAVTATMLNTASTASSWRLLLALALGATTCWLTLSHASAHAAYESSTPGFAEVLDRSPGEISIRFTQELFRRAGANRITLTQAGSGSELRLGLPEVDNQDRHMMTASVQRELEPGRYVVSWTNLSAEDGDADSGSYPFYIERGPIPAEAEEDRLAAAELLIAYPGDETAQPNEEAATPQPDPNIVRSESSGDADLGVGPIIWLVVGTAAALLLVGSLGFHLGRRARGG